MYVTNGSGDRFVATNLQMLEHENTFILVAVNIGLNLLLIPKYSYYGASFATVVN